MNALNSVVEIVIGTLVSAVIGGLIGAKRNQIGGGIISGLTLGPIGWLIAYFFEDRHPKCPECNSRLIKGETRCSHCHKEISQVEDFELTFLSHTVKLPKMLYLFRDGREDGPYTVKEVLEKCERQEIDPTTLCACPGDRAWVPIKQRTRRVRMA